MPHNPETAAETAARIAKEDKARADAGQPALTAAERAAAEKAHAEADAKRAAAEK